MAAFALKEQGNEYFKANHFKEAEEMYSQAIAHRPADPKLFGNRALTRLKMSAWREAERDSRKAIELYGSNDHAAMKVHFYLAQALLNLRHTTEALLESKLAYQICLETRDSSAEVMSQFILRAKQAHWQTRETTRLREMNSTLATIENLLDQQLEGDLADVQSRFSKGDIGSTGRGEEQSDIQKEADERRRVVRAAFAIQNNPESSERSVPDWAVDPITFEIMHDPVITPSGVSYERVSLLRHLRQSGLDPVTREKLTEKDLVSNVGLKNACSEFIDNNGWAVDW